MSDDGKIVPFDDGPRFTPEIEERAVELTREGQSLRAVADKLGITFSVLNRWIRSHAQFAASMAEAREEAIRGHRRSASGHGMGTPRTPQVVNKFLAELRDGMSRGRAAALVGIPHSALERWLDDPEFELVVHAAEAQWEKEMLSILRDPDTGGRWTLWMTWLERRFPTEYARRFEMSDKERQAQARKLGAMLAEVVAQGLADVGLSPDQQEKVRGRLVKALEKAV